MTRREEAEWNFRRAAEEADITVIGEYRGVMKPVLCRCPQGHVCRPRPCNIQQGQGWCRTCAGQSPEYSETNFRQTAADAGVTILGEYRGVMKPVLCRCPNGHECRPRPNDIRQGQGWCEQRAGLNHDVLYVIRNETTVKFGITSRDGKERLANHKADSLREEVRLFTGLPEGEARKTENLVKSALWEAGWQPVRGTEYFDIGALPLILDVIDGAMTLPEISNQVYDWSTITGEPDERDILGR